MKIMNKRGQFAGLAIGVVILVVAIALLISFLVSPTLRFTIIGIGIIAAAIFGIAPPMLSGEFTNKKLTFFFLIVVVGVIFIVIPKIIPMTVLGAGTYIQAPTFYYYECNAASQPVESTHVNLAIGNTGGWIICPANTDTCDLWIRQTESTSWYSSNRRVVYQVCHNNGANCDPQVFVTTDSSFFNQQRLHTLQIPNLLITDRVFINYQYQKIIYGWEDQPNGAEWYQTYKPFILWKVDMFGGGRTEYTSIEQGCNFPASSVSGLLNTITNSIKQINTQTSTSNTNVPFYKTRNFIGTYVPISTANVNFVTYGGKDGYCLSRQIFAITTAVTNGGTYQIVDSNFNTRLADSVACCPGETEPTRKCNSNFGWDPIQEAQCSQFNACAGSTWMPSSSKTLIRYNCVNSKCVPETKTVDCISNLDCGNNQVCDTSTYKCINVEPGPITCLANQTLVNGKCVDNAALGCKWFQDSYSTVTKDYGILYWRVLFGNPLTTPISGCKTAGWVYAVIIGGIVFVLVLVIIILYAPKRNSRRGRR